MLAPVTEDSLAQIIGDIFRKSRTVPLDRVTTMITKSYAAKEDINDTRESRLKYEEYTIRFIYKEKV